MNRKRSWCLLLLLPLVIWALAIGAYLFQTMSMDKTLHSVNGLTYGFGEQLLRVDYSRSAENEVSTNVVTVRDVNDEIVYRNTIQIDHDLFGKGIVNGIQMDSDPELEILAWGSNLRVGKSFVLDYVDGNLQPRDYDDAPEKIKSFVAEYRNRATGSTVFLGLLLLLTPLYYLACFLVWLFGILKGRKVASEQN